MSSTTQKIVQDNQPRIGNVSAQQPLSGITRVNASFAVSGLGHGGAVTAEKGEQSPSPDSNNNYVK